MLKRESSLSFYFWVCFQNPDINKPVFQSQTVSFCSSTSLLIWHKMWHNMTQTKMKEIEVFHHYCLKKILYLPTNTRSVMCQSLLGVGSLVGEIDKRKLLFFHKITNLPDTSLTKKIFLRRLFLYFQRQHSLCRSMQMGFIPDLYIIKISIVKVS